MKELHSFDIYDTLITRKTATPKGIFALMQKCLLELDKYQNFPYKLRKNFYLIRIQAEKVARNTYVRGEVQDLILPRIYESMQVMELLTDEQMQTLMQLEIDLEKENSLPVWENIEKVKKLVSEGKRVVLISDMYLEAKTIRDILCGMDEVFEKIPMYVSGDLQKVKMSHILYHYVREQEQVAFTDWHHYGDNAVADVEIPKLLGINATHYEANKLLPWEMDLLENKEDNSDLQLLLGVSKNVKNNRAKNIAYQVGYGYSAQILLPYVLWVLNESSKKGIQKLVFIARDGYILKKIVDILIERYHVPVATEYLYGSRKAWRLPAVATKELDIAELFRWSYPSRIHTYEQVAKVLGLSFDELNEFVSCKGRENMQFSPSVLQEIIRILVKNQEKIAQRIIEKQKKNREAAICYLRQELTNDNKKTVFVELIGSGYSQRNLANLTKDYFPMPVETFYYRLDNVKNVETNVNYPFFSNRIPMGEVVEALCGACHGQTNGYMQSDGKWVPVFGEDEGQELEAYGYLDYVDGIEAYTKTLCDLYKQLPTGFGDLTIMSWYFEYLQQGCNSTLYNYIADMPYGITGTEKKVASFAPALTNRDLKKIYLWHKGEPVFKFYKGHSLEFSLTRLTPKQQKKLAHYEKYGDDARIKWIRKNFFAEKVCNSKYALLAENIVLYGAGKKGKLLYEQLTSKHAEVAKSLGISKENVAKVSLWVDKDYNKYQDFDLQVFSPEQILKSDYQQVVIAVARKEVAIEIEEELVQMGVDRGKIIWLNPNERFL